MKSIFKMMVVAFGGWAALNWSADNPMKVKMLRKEVNQTLADGYEFASTEAHAIQKKAQNSK